MFTVEADSMKAEMRKNDAERRKMSDTYLKQAAACDHMNRTRTEYLREAWDWARAARVKPNTFILKAERMGIASEAIIEVLRGC